MTIQNYVLFDYKKNILYYFFLKISCGTFNLLNISSECPVNREIHEYIYFL